MGQYLVFGTLGLALVLFAWGRIRHDLVALISLLVLVVAGVVDPASAFEGFGHPAVITVAAVLIIGRALEQSGLIDLLGKQVMRIGNNLLLQIMVLSTLVAVMSAFMNNVGALAIMMPIAIMMARKGGHPPSYILMPIAFASLLGGMTTLIGTPPNIIIATFRSDESGTAFGMFDFSPVGGVIALVGLVFISFLGWRLLPKRSGEKPGEELFDIDGYLSEVKIGKDSRLKDIALGKIPDISEADVQILGILRAGRRIHAPGPAEVLLAGDVLSVEAEASELSRFVDDSGVKLEGARKFRKDAQGADKTAISEVVVMAGSPLIGHTASDLKIRSRYGLNLLAMARKNRTIRQRLDRISFIAGDVLLLQGREHLLDDTTSAIGCLPLAQRGLRIGYKRKIPLALGIFGSSIALVVSGFLPVQAAFSLAAVGMILSGVLPVKEMYASVDWPVIVLLGAMIPVGGALETSGGAARIASAILVLGDSVPAWGLLAVILVVTMFLSDIINNAATVVLMAPIAISVAKGLGLSVDPFLMAVAVGASCAFLSPIGHQSNTLVMGPGGYKFTDYARMGFPLELLITIVAVPLIMLVWPM
ncbi:MAG: SLC13 family permease [Clostridia bacterium]